MNDVMNEITIMLEEADITFGQAKRLFYEYLYNLRVSFPNSSIYLATADVKTCFRLPCIHPGLTGAFWFYADGCYCLATAMVFWSNTSVISWEPFQRSINALTLVFVNLFDLVMKHKKYLDMITWDIPVNPHQRQSMRFPVHWTQDFWMTKEVWHSDPIRFTPIMQC